MNAEHWLNGFKESMSRLMNGRQEKKWLRDIMHIRDSQKGSIRSELPKEQLEAYKKSSYKYRSDEDEKNSQSDNPLYHPHRYGEEFINAYYRIRDSLHVHDPRNVALLRLTSAMAEVQLAREPGQWARDEVIRACECAILGRNALPPGSKANLSQVDSRLIEELVTDWRNRYSTEEDARRDVVEYLQSPIRPGAVTELVALVAPMSRNKKEAKEWVAEYLGRSWGRVDKLSRKKST